MANFNFSVVIVVALAVAVFVFPSVSGITCSNDGESYTLSNTTGRNRFRGNSFRALDSGLLQKVFTRTTGSLRVVAQESSFERVGFKTILDSSRVLSPSPTPGVSMAAVAANIKRGKFYRIGMYWTDTRLYAFDSSASIPGITNDCLELRGGLSTSTDPTSPNFSPGLSSTVYNVGFEVLKRPECPIYANMPCGGESCVTTGTTATCQCSSSNVNAYDCSPISTVGASVCSDNSPALEFPITDAEGTVSMRLPNTSDPGLNCGYLFEAIPNAKRVFTFQKFEAINNELSFFSRSSSSSTFSRAYGRYFGTLGDSTFSISLCGDVLLSWNSVTADPSVVWSIKFTTEPENSLTCAEGPTSITRAIDAIIANESPSPPPPPPLSADIDGSISSSPSNEILIALVIPFLTVVLIILTISFIRSCLRRRSGDTRDIAYDAEDDAELRRRRDKRKAAEALANEKRRQLEEVREAKRKKKRTEGRLSEWKRRNGENDNDNEDLESGNTSDIDSESGSETETATDATSDVNSEETSNEPSESDETSSDEPPSYRKATKKKKRNAPLNRFLGV